MTWTWVDTRVNVNLTSGVDVDEGEYREVLFSLPPLFSFSTPFSLSPSPFIPFSLPPFCLPSPSPLFSPLPPPFSHLPPPLSHPPLHPRLLTNAQTSIQMEMYHAEADVKWAKKRQNQQMTCAPSEDSDQPGHPPSLISLHCALNR